MEQAKHWFKTSSPLVKALLAISVTSAIVVINRAFYVPYTRRQKYREAEAWANQIIEQEEKLIESGEPYTEVGNLRY